MEKSAARAIDRIRDGHYARKQLFSKSWLISWSHRRRFETGLELASRFAGAEILDYGCGDGTFLALLISADQPPARAVGAEISEGLIRGCNDRLGQVGGLRFVLTDQLDRPEHQGAYDGVVCMEVLEHVVEVEPELDRIHRLLRPGGTLIVSVPVETGLPVAVKEAARTVAGWRGIGDYPGGDAYTWRELLASVFAGADQHIDRPVHPGKPLPFHSHKGFNWRRLQKLLAERFEIEEVLASPLNALPPALNSQAWFIARRPAEC